MRKLHRGMSYYTEPKIKQTSNGRWYVYFHYSDDFGNKTPVKIYSGRSFGVEGRGNYSGASVKYKQMYFGDLRNRVSNALSTGWYPGKESDLHRSTVEEAIKSTSELINKSKINGRYKSNLIQLGHIAPFDPENMIRLTLDSSHILTIMPHSISDGSHRITRIEESAGMSAAKMIANNTSQLESAFKYILGAKSAVSHFIEKLDDYINPISEEQKKSLEELNEIVKMMVNE